MHGVDAYDHIWKKCCAPHKMLLFIDGLIEEWDGELGLFDIEDAANMPFIFQILTNSGDLRNYDISGMGGGSSLDDCEATSEP